MAKKAKRRFSLTLTGIYVTALDRLVDEGIYLEHQVAIRAALRLLFHKHGIELLSSDLVDKVEKFKN